MAKISTYLIDGTIDPADKLIGTDGTQGADNGKTKNFSIANLQSFIGKGGVVLQKKVEITNDQLKALQSTAVTLFDEIADHVILPVRVLVKVVGQAAGNSLSFGDELLIKYTGASNSIIAINETPQNLASGVGYSSYHNSSDLADIKSIELSTDGSVTETGTSVTKIILYISYQITDVS